VSIRVVNKDHNEADREFSTGRDLDPVRVRQHQQVAAGATIFHVDDIDQLLVSVGLEGEAQRFRLVIDEQPDPQRPPPGPRPANGA